MQLHQNVRGRDCRAEKNILLAEFGAHVCGSEHGGWSPGQKSGAFFDHSKMGFFELDNLDSNL
jgi:hypothetical protein